MISPKAAGQTQPRPSFANGRRSPTLIIAAQTFVFGKPSGSAFTKSNRAATNVNAVTET